MDQQCTVCRHRRGMGEGWRRERSAADRRTRHGGFTTPETHGKWSLRASATGELVFDNIKVPKENLFPEIRGPQRPASCASPLRATESAGALLVPQWIVYDTALRYSKQRIQFGKPIAGFQLQQRNSLKWSPRSQSTIARLASRRIENEGGHRCTDLHGQTQ